MDPEMQTLRSLYLEFDKLDAWLTVKKRVQIPLSLFRRVQHKANTTVETDISWTESFT